MGMWGTAPWVAVKRLGIQNRTEIIAINNQYIEKKEQKAV
jgi:hypothetical protein